MNRTFFEDTIDMKEVEEEYDSYGESLSKDKLFGNLKDDITMEGMPVWKGVLCTLPNVRHAYTMMKSNLWPGAYAVTHKSYVIN